MHRLLALLLCCSAAAADTVPDCPLDGNKLARLQTAAGAGQSEAQFELGVYYFQGVCVVADVDQSTQWFRRAAEQGHGPAAFNLGNAYHHGRGVSQDVEQTQFWWRRAAFKGLPNAAYNLGVWYLKHHDSKAHRELGVAWLETAAEANWSDAGALLARLPVPQGAKFGRDWQREPLRSEARLLTQAPTAYVIQLFSGESRDSAQRFIEQRNLGSHAMIFRLPVEGTTRWNVAFGNYPNRRAAKQTLRTLRQDLASFNPWARPVAQLQTIIVGVWRRQEQTALAETW